MSHGWASSDVKMVLTEGRWGMSVRPVALYAGEGRAASPACSGLLAQEKMPRHFALAPALKSRAFVRREALAWYAPKVVAARMVTRFPTGSPSSTQRSRKEKSLSQRIYEGGEKRLARPYKPRMSWASHQTWRGETDATDAMRGSAALRRYDLVACPTFPPGAMETKMSMAPSVEARVPLTGITSWL